MPVGSGYSDKEYDKRKRARDELERDLVKHGVNPEKARDVANKTAHETDNRRKQEGKE